MKTQIVTLKAGLKTLNNDFSAGEQFKVLGYHGTMVRLSRVGDNAKLITPLENVGLFLMPHASSVYDNTDPMTPKLVAIRAKTDKCDASHSDESGPSRRIVIATCLAGKYSGETAMHLTPSEEREYNDGMAKLAEIYPG